MGFKQRAIVVDYAIYSKWDDQARHATRVIMDTFFDGVYDIILAGNKKLSMKKYESKAEMFKDISEITMVPFSSLADTPELINEQCDKYEIKFALIDKSSKNIKTIMNERNIPCLTITN